MSDCILKIIPADPYYRVSEQNMLNILRYLKSNIKADQIDAEASEAPAFVDCGGNLEKIECPLCGAVIDFDWWSDAMNASWADHFRSLSVTLPCCGRTSSLNDLRYHAPCGFSCVEFRIRNPEDEPSGECLAFIQKLLGTPVRFIREHL